MSSVSEIANNFVIGSGEDERNVTTKLKSKEHSLEFTEEGVTSTYSLPEYGELKYTRDFFVEFTENGITIPYLLPNYKHLDYSKVLAVLEGVVDDYDSITRFIVMELRNNHEINSLFHHVVILDMVTGVSHKLIVPKMYGFSIDNVSMKRHWIDIYRDNIECIEIGIRHIPNDIEVEDVEYEVDESHTTKEIITSNIVYLTE